MKNPPVFLTEINSSHKLLFLTKNSSSANFWQRNDNPLKVLGNLHGKDILSVILGKIMDNESCLLTWMQNFDYQFRFNIEKQLQKVILLL